MNRSRLPYRSRFASLALLGALTFAPACKGKDQDKAAEPSKTDDKSANTTTEQPKQPQTPAPSGPVSDPTDSPAIAEVGEVVATVQIPSGTNMSDIAAIIDSIQPGASMMLKMQLPALLEQSAGFDLGKSAKLDAPMSFVILDPTSHPQPLAVLVEAKDPAKLSAAATGAGHAVEQREGLTLIGPAGVVDAAKDFAFTNLGKYPDHTEIIIYPQRLMNSYAGVLQSSLDMMGSTLAAQGGEAMTGMLRAYAEGLIAVGEQTQRVVLSVAKGQASADLIVRFYPVAGSTFADFVGAQVATDHALLAKLPNRTGMMLMSGNIHAGPARDALVDFSIDFMGQMYGNMSADEWKQLMTPWLDNLDGRFAMTMDMSIDANKGAAMQMTALMGVNDSASLRGAWRTMLEKMTATPAIEMMGMKITATHEAKVLEHDGVEVDFYSTTVDTSALPAAQAEAIERAGTGKQAMHLAAFDNFAVMSSPADDGQGVRAAIDAARGKGDTLALSRALTDAVEASKQRGDSMLMYFDFAAVINAAPTPPPQVPFSAMSMAVGKYEGGLSVRMSLIK